MKSLTKFGSLIRGCMIGLALNLSILPMVQAQQASPTRPPEDPSAIVPIDEPVVTPGNPDPFGAAIEMQRRFFEQIFSREWTLFSGAFLLDNHITAEGIHRGTNFFNEPYTVHTLTALDMDMTVGATPAELEWIELHDVRCSLVVGALSNGGTTLGCIAISASLLNDAGARVNNLLLIGEIEHDPLVFEGLGAAVERGLYQPQPPRDNPGGFGPVGGGSKDDPISDACRQCGQDYREKFEEAERTRDRKIDAANAEYQAAIAVAQAEFDAARRADRSQFNAEAAIATGGLALALKSCVGGLVIPGIGTVTAGAWVAASSGIALGGIAVRYFALRSRVADRSGVLVARNAQATIARNNKIEDAYDEFFRRISQIDRELNECLRAHHCLKIIVPLEN